MDLIDALLDLCKDSRQPIIAIDGPAGAGKTTLAHNISLACASHYSITKIHMDDLYDGWDNALSDQLTQILTYIVESHKNCQPISISTYNWSQGVFSPTQEIASSELLILEGVGSGQSAIRDSLAALVWMDIDPSQGLQRVLERDGDAIGKEMKKWLATQEKHFRDQGTQKAADFVLTT
jgi:uridine kinase